MGASTDAVNKKRKIVPLAIIEPTFGRLTWDSEGTEGGVNHSRVPHVPSNSSGLTIGRGYDMKKRSASDIKLEMMAAGLDEDSAKLLSKAHGKVGGGARKFKIDNKLADFEISPQVQYLLFKKDYEFMFGEVVRISNENEKTYGVFALDKVPLSVMELLVDLRFRGDYSPATRPYLQKAAIEGDLIALQSIMSDKDFWVDQREVPLDRFTRRKAFIDAEVQRLDAEAKARASWHLPSPSSLPRGTSSRPAASMSGAQPLNPPSRPRR